MGALDRIRAAHNDALPATNAVEQLALDEVAPPYLSIELPAASEFVLEVAPPNHATNDSRSPRDSTVIWRLSSDGMFIEREKSSNRVTTDSDQVRPMGALTCKNFPDSAYGYRVIGRYRFQVTSAGVRVANTPVSVIYYNPVTGAAQGAPTIPDPNKVWAVSTGMLLETALDSEWDHHRATPTIGPTGEIASVRFSGSEARTAIAEFTLVDLSRPAYEVRHIRLTGAQIKAGQAAASAQPWVAGQAIAAGDLRYGPDPYDISLNSPPAGAGTEEGRIDYVFRRRANTPTTTAATFAEEYLGGQPLWDEVGFRDTCLVADLMENPDGTGAALPLSDASNAMYHVNFNCGTGSGTTNQRRYRQRQHFQVLPFDNENGMVGLRTTIPSSSYDVEDDAELVVTAIGSARSDFQVSRYLEPMGPRRKESEPLETDWHGEGGGDPYSFLLVEEDYDAFDAPSEYAPFISVLSDQNVATSTWQGNVTHLDATAAVQVDGKNDKSSRNTPQWLQLQTLDLGILAEADEALYTAEEINAHTFGWSIEVSPETSDLVNATKLRNISTGDELPLFSTTDNTHRFLIDQSMFTPTGLLNNTRPGRTDTWRLENADGSEVSANISLALTDPPMWLLASDSQANIRLEYENPASNDPADFDSLLVHLNIRDGLETQRNDYLWIEEGDLLPSGAPTNLADGELRTLRVFSGGVWSASLTNSYGTVITESPGLPVAIDNTDDLLEDPYSDDATTIAGGTLVSDGTGCVQPAPGQAGTVITETFSQQVGGPVRTVWVQVQSPLAQDDVGPFLRDASGEGMVVRHGAANIISISRLRPDGNIDTGVNSAPAPSALIAGDWLGLQLAEGAAFGGSDGWAALLHRGGVQTQLVPDPAQGEVYIRDLTNLPAISDPPFAGRFFRANNLNQPCSSGMEAGPLPPAPAIEIAAINGLAPGASSVVSGEALTLGYSGDHAPSFVTIKDEKGRNFGPYALVSVDASSSSTAVLALPDVWRGVVTITTDTGIVAQSTFPSPVGFESVSLQAALATAGLTANFSPTHQLEYRVTSSTGQAVEFFPDGNARFDDPTVGDQYVDVRTLAPNGSYTALSKVYPFTPIAKLADIPAQTVTVGSMLTLDLTTYFSDTITLPPGEVGSSGHGLIVTVAGLTGATIEGLGTPTPTLDINTVAADGAYSVTVTATDPGDVVETTTFSVDVVTASAALAGEAIGQDVLVGDLSIAALLAGQASGSGVLIGELTAIDSLAGAAIGMGVLTGDLLVSLLIVEDGTGLINANSLTTIEFVREHLAARGREGEIASFSNEQLQEGLVKIADYMDARFGERWRGLRVDRLEGRAPADTQSLAWGRVGRTRDGVPFDTTGVPDPIQRAAAEYLPRLLAGQDLFPDVAASSSSSSATGRKLKLGPLELQTSGSTGSSSSTGYPTFPAVDRLLAPYLKSTSGLVRH